MTAAWCADAAIITPMMSRRGKTPPTAHAGHRRGGFQPTRRVVDHRPPIPAASWIADRAIPAASWIADRRTPPRRGSPTARIRVVSRDPHDPLLRCD
jgi:hypothetical protein